MQRLCDKYNRAIDSIHQLVSLFVWRLSFPHFVCKTNVTTATEMGNSLCDESLSQLPLALSPTLILRATAIIQIWWQMLELASVDM